MDVVYKCKECKTEFTIREMAISLSPGSAEKEPINCPECGHVHSERRSSGVFFSTKVH